MNGKVYIGKHQTARLDDDYFGSGKHLRHSVTKYGRENFVKEIIHVFDTEDEMNAKEADLVTEEFCKRDDTYNICEGGKGGWSYINRSGLNIGGQFANTPEAKEKKSQTLKLFHQQNKDFAKKYAVRISDSLKDYYSKNTNPFLGKKHTVETKQIMSEKAKFHQTGKKNSQFGSCWITNGFESKKIKKLDMVPEGWYYGRKMNEYASWSKQTDS